MLGIFLLGLDELARIKPLRTGQLGGNERRQAFAVADDGVRCLLRQVLDEVDTLEDIFQFVEQLAHLALHNHLRVKLGKHPFDHLHMAADNLAELILVCGIARSRHARGLYQLIRDAAQGRHHHNDRLLPGLHNAFHSQDTLYGTYRRPAEFHYFHRMLYLMKLLIY